MKAVSTAVTAENSPATCHITRSMESALHTFHGWLKPWCDKNELELIATKLKIKNGFVTGRFQTKNCYGIEKAVRVREIYDLDDYDHIYAYGDSRGDRELLELAHTKNFRAF